MYIFYQQFDVRIIMVSAYGRYAPALFCEVSSGVQLATVKSSSFV